MKNILALIVILFISQSYGAIDATCQWDMKSAGSNTNGGGFVSSGGGTDWSQQTSAKETQTDGACSDHVTFAFTSASASFQTDDVAGNLIYISDTGDGGHFVVGWYEVKSVTNETTIVLDRDPTDGTNDTGADYKLGGCLASPEDNVLEALSAGNTVWIQSSAAGTASVAMSKDGTAALGISLVGYKSTHGDACTGTDRPIIDWDDGVYAFILGDYVIIRNLRFSLQHTAGVSLGSYDLAYNCSFDNISDGADYYAVTIGSTYIKVVDCEMTGSVNKNITAINGHSQFTLSNCYIHDVADGIDSPGYTVCISFNRFVDCTGTAILSGGGSLYQNNTFHTCGKGIDCAAVGTDVIINNIFDECTVTAEADSAFTTIYCNYNNYDGDGIGDNLTSLGSDLNTDITLEGDYTLGATAYGVVGGNGLGGLDIGWDQSYNAGGGGGQPIIGGSVIR